MTLLIVLTIEQDQPWAVQARLTALIKTKNFEQALELLKGKEKVYGFQHAYVLHRLGRNKDALKAIQAAGNIESAEAKHLVA